MVAAGFIFHLALQVSINPLCSQLGLVLNGLVPPLGFFLGDTGITLVPAI
jgi:hypothetical protein